MRRVKINITFWVVCVLYTSTGNKYFLHAGLAILLPFLISRNKHWKQCKLRIFTAGSLRNIDQAKLRYAIGSKQSRDTTCIEFYINFGVETLFCEVGW